VQDGQPAHARIEDADRTGVHRASVKGRPDCAGTLTALRRPVALLFAFAFVLVPASATRALAGNSKESGLASAKFIASGASQALGRAGIKLRYEQQQADDAVARITFYVPKGYRVSTGRAVGTSLGTAAATVFAADRNAVIPATGPVEIASPSDFTAQAAACTGTTTHDEFWALRLEPADIRLVVPAFVDLITEGPLASVAAAQIVACLEPGDLPPDTSGRAPLGAKVLLAEFTSNSIVNPAAGGAYRWRATVTPYTPSTGKTNDSGTVELQSIVALTSYVSLRARTGKGARPGVQTFTYGGTLIANARGLADAVVEVFRGVTADALKKIKSQATSVRGSFRGSFTVTQASRASSLFLLARAVAGDQDLGPAACAATFDPIPCRKATVGAFSVSSRLVKVTIRAAPRRKGK
jgi:hypothetical protein